MSSTEHEPQFLDHKVVDRSGAVIGKIEDVVFDPHTGVPKWAVVNPGVLHRRHYLPLTAAQHNDQGDIAVPFDKDLVTGAPVASGEHVLSEDDERALQEHYAGGSGD